MVSEWKRKLPKIATLLACFFFILPCGMTFYWGNMSVYISSYTIIRLNSTVGVQGPWILSMFNVAENASFMALGMFLIRYIDRKLLIIAGIVIAAISSSVTYFAIQNSMILAIITFGILFGFGSGLLYGNGIQLTVEMADENTGFLLSIVQNSFPAGGILINELITWYVNPDNKSPDYYVESKQYFTQKDVLDRVPSMYLAICGVFLTFHLIGFILLQIGSPIKSKRTSSPWKVLKNAENEDAKITKALDTTYNSCSDDGIKDTNHDYKPVNTLKMGSFYVLWLSFFIGDVAMIFINSYYKSYGQIWIHNDHFLTNVGTISIFASILFKIGWGILIDKAGIKNCLIIFAGSVVVVNSWYYFTPMTSTYLYLFATMVYIVLSGTLYITHLTAATLLFGKAHASGNCSLVLTAPFTCNLVAPLLFGFVLSSLGWFATFAIISGLMIIDLIIIMVFFPQNPKK